jgi:hypothetical protein
VDLHSYFSEFLDIVSLIDLAEPSLPKETYELVLLYSRPASNAARLEPAIAGVLLLIEEAALFDVQRLLLIEALECFLIVRFLSAEEVGLASQGDFPLLGFLSLFALLGLFFCFVEQFLLLLNDL